MALWRGHTWPMPWSCFPSSLFLFKLTLGPRTKTSNKPQEGGGKLGKAKAAAPTQQSAGPDAKPSTQSPHMLLWPAALGWLKSPANPHPHRQASHCPQAFLSMPPLSFTVLMTRHKLPHIHPSRAKIITLQLTTGMRTKLGHRRGFA